MLNRWIRGKVCSISINQLNKKQIEAKKLLDSCKNTTVKNFIFSSTAAIYKEGHYRASRIIGEFFAINEAVSFIQELTWSNVDIYSY